MTERRYHRRKKGGSLVFPLIMIVLGVLFLLDNIGVTRGIDWNTIWKLWPVILIALGVEILLGRRVSFGAALVMVVIVVVAGAAVWWSVVAEGGEKRLEHVDWPMNGVERAELDLDMGVGALDLRGYSDMADLLEADMVLYGVGIRENLEVEDDVARGWIRYDREKFFAPQIFGGDKNDWDLRLNTRVRWELTVDTGAGDVRLDLSELRVSQLDLHAGVGSTRVTLPERGTVKGRVDGGIGDIQITVPDGVQARFQVERGIGDLTIGGRFKRQGDYYETEDFSRAESYIELEVDIGIGSVTIR
jgi:hypothetical protein